MRWRCRPLSSSRMRGPMPGKSASGSTVCRIRATTTPENADPRASMNRAMSSRSSTAAWRHPLDDVLVRDQLALADRFIDSAAVHSFVNVGRAAPNEVRDVQAVVDVLHRRVIGEARENLLDDLFRASVAHVAAILPSAWRVCLRR